MKNKNLIKTLLKGMRAVCLVLPLLLLSAPAYAANLLPSTTGQWHFGFEAAGATLDNPACWEEIGTAASIDNHGFTSSHEGSRVCRLDNLIDSYSAREIWSATCTVTAGNDYYGGAWAYVTTTTVPGADIKDVSFKLGIRWYDASDNFISAVSSEGIKLAAFDTWEKIIYSTLTAPGSATQARFVVSALETNNLDYDPYIDDAEFIEVVSADTTPPAAVSNLTALTGSADGEVNLSWIAPGDDGTSGAIAGGSIKILASTYSITGDNFDSITHNPFYTYAIQFSTSYTTQATDHNYTMTGLYPGTTYYFAVKVADEANNWSSWSYSGLNTKSTAPACDLNPDIVTLGVPTPADGQITLNWTEPSAFDIDYYFVEVSSFGTHPDGDFSSIIFSSNVPAGYSGHTSTLTLVNNNTYYYRVTTYDWGDGSDGLDSVALSSAYAYANAFPYITPPLAPGGFSGTAVSQSAINWSWTDVDGEGGYSLRYSTDTGTIIAGLAAGTTFWVETGLSLNTSYYRVIAATNTAGTSPLTSVATSWTLANPPTGSDFTGVFQSSVTLTWGINNNPGYTRYGISYSTNINFSFNVSTPVVYASGLTADTTAVTGLTANTTYHFRVWAYNGDEIATAFDTVISTKTLSLSTSEWTDDFSDGDFTSNPVWTGDTGSWKINESFELQLAAPAVAQWESLVTESTVDADEWKKWIFYFKYADGDPSAANQMRVYLMSDQQDIEVSLNGYFLQLGESGNNDSLKFFSQTGTSSNQIATANHVSTGTAGYTVKVQKKGSDWEIFIDEGKSADATTSRGTWFEATYDTASYFGVSVNHSTTYLDKWTFDNFAVGPIFPDTTPPAAVSHLTALTGSADGEVNLSWIAPGDDGTSGDISGGYIKILASTYSITAANFESITHNPYYTYAVQFSTSYTTQGSEHSYTMDGLYPGTTYYFAVLIADESDNWSSWSTVGVNTDNSTYAPDFPPTIISDFAAPAVYGAVMLSWTEPGAPDIEKYEVFRDSTSPYNFSDAYSFEVTAPANSYNDTGLEEGVTYYYRVKTWDYGPASGGLYSVALSSAYSSVVSACVPISGYEASSQMGNEFVIDATYARTLNSALESLSYRFIAQAGKTLESVYLSGFARGSGAYYTLGIETNNSATGQPSGSYVWSGSSATFVNTLFSGGWKEIKLNNSGALTSGATYHIVIKPKENVNSSNYVGLHYTTPLNEKWVNGLSSNNYRTVMRGYSGDWNNLSAEPVYMLSYSDSSFEGNPYPNQYLGTQSKIQSNNYAGEKFTLTSEEKMNAINVYVSRSGTPADHLSYVIQDINSSLVVSSGVVISSQTALSMNTGEFYWKTGVFDSPKTLAAGDYRLYFVSTGSVDETNCYALNSIGNWSDPSSGAATYDGTNSVFTYSSSGGDSWFTIESQDIAFLLIYDETPPANIDSLAAATGNSYGTVNLSWLSPGDDLNSGNIEGGIFEIWYSTTNDAFATHYSTVVLTANTSPFEEQTYTVGNLQGGALYYFGVITKDELGNASGMSNIVSALAQSAAVFDVIGNEFVVQSAGGIYNLDAADKKVSYRFTAQNSRTVDKLRIYTGQTGSLIIYDVRLESDNGGEPSGTLTWAGAEDSFEIENSAGWQILDITNGQITKGETYHIVVQYREVNPAYQDNPLVYVGDKRRASPRGTKPRNENWLNNSLNPDRYSMYYDGSEWKYAGTYSEPVYVVEFADGTSEGNAFYTGGGASGNVYDANFPGEKMDVLTTQSINGARIYVRKSGEALDHLYYTLRNITDGVDVVSGVAAYRWELDSDWQWWTVPFGSTYTITADKSYRFYLRSPLSDDSNNCYRIGDANTGNSGNSVYTSITFGGSNTFFTKSSDSGSSWSDDDGSDISYTFVYDRFPPSVIENVFADEGATQNSIYLSWTAPYEDNNDSSSGAVTSYEVKYATKSFDYSDWNASFVHSCSTTLVPSPYRSGSKQSMALTGLTPGVTYYFRVRAIDDMLNYSVDATFPQAFALPQPEQEVDNVVISEFTMEGAASTVNEFVEIYNPMDFDVDIAGFQLRYAPAATAQAEPGWDVIATVPDGVVLKPNKFYLFGRSSYYKHAIPYDASFTTTIPNEGGHFCIYDTSLSSSAAIVDKVGWGSAGKPEGTAISTVTWVKGGSFKRDLSTPSLCDTDDNSVDFYFASRSQPDNFLSPAQPDDTWPQALAPSKEEIGLYFTPRNYNTPRIRQKLVDLIDGAASHVYMVIYTLTSAEIIDALNSAANRGVIVRLIVDDYTTGTANTNIADQLSDNIKWTVNDEKLNADDNFIMHHKFAVIDGKTVYTGSANFTYGGFGPQDNSNVVIVSTAVAKNFEEEFREMWSGYYKGYKINSPSNPVSVGNSEVRTYFSPQNDPLESTLPNLIATAEESVFFAVFTFSKDTVRDKLYEMHSAGVVVQGIFDSQQIASAASTAYENGDGTGLKDRGLMVGKKSGLSGDIMHNKLMVIDKEIIVSGSANWTPAGSGRNDENMVVIRDRRLGRQLVKYFKNLWAGTSEKTGSVEEDTTSPHSISGLSAAVTGTRAIALQWSQSTESDFSRYYVFVSSSPITGNQIFKGTEESDENKLIPETVITNQAGTGVVIRTCGGAALSSGTSYYFALLQMDTSGNESYLAAESTSGPVLATDEADATPPASISDLAAVTGQNYGEILLSWTAVGDDGLIGIASEYDIRYSPSPIQNEMDFSAAVRLADIEPPLPAGTLESLIVDNLYPGSSYFFAIKVLDEADNLSLSNSAGAFPKTHPVVINEFVYDPAGADTGKEWIELFNYSTFSVSLAGWTVEKADSEDWSAATRLFTLTGSIPGNSWFLCAQADIGPQMEADFYDWENSALMPNSSKTGVRLKDARGNVIDYVGYNWAHGLAEGGAATPPATNGKSLSRKTDGVDTNNNYKDFEVLTEPTPTPSGGPDTEPPETADDLSAVPGSSAGEIVISWTAPADMYSDARRDNNEFAGYILKFATFSSLADGATDWWDAAMEYVQEWAVGPRGSVESKTLHLRPGTTYYFLLKTYDGSFNQNMSDFSNAADARALEGDVGSPVRINEVAPAQYASDGSDWIEFYNAGPTVDIFGWEIYEAYTSSRNYIEKVEGSWEFPSGAYLVLRFNQSRNMTTPMQMGSNTWELYTNNEGLAASDNIIILKSSSSVIIDAVAYADRSGSLSGTSKFRAAYNYIISAGQWSGIAATGDNDAIVEKYCAPSVYLSRNRTIARDELSSDGINPEHKNWFLSKQVSRGLVNPVPDTTAPAAILDFNAFTGINRGTVGLKWHSAGNDGHTGTAAGYIVRYSLSEIRNNEDFEKASNIDVASRESQSDKFYWPPKAAGSLESYIAGGLEPGVTYYFAIKSEDETLNSAPLSNVVSAAASNAVGSNVRINEFAPLEAGGEDWIELYFNAYTDITGWSVYNIEAGENDEALVKTFSYVAVSTGDYLVVNLNVQGTDESTDKGNNDYWDVYADYDLKGFEGVLILRDSAGNVVDFVAYSQGSEPDWDNLWSATVEFKQWSPEEPSVANAVNWKGGVSGKSISRNQYSADTDDTLSGAASDWFVTRQTKGRENRVIAPAALTDLSAESGASEGEVRLSWTAQGSDGSIGNNSAGYYEVRYSTKAPSWSMDQWWNDITVNTDYQGSCYFTEPQNAGVGEMRVVTGLYPDRIFYFAVKTINSDGDISDVSNSTACFITDLEPAAPAAVDIPWIRWSVSSATIYWSAGLPDVVAYLIERSSYPGAVFDTITISEISGRANSFYLDGTLAAGNYDYYVRAKDEKGNVGPASTITVTNALLPEIVCDYPVEVFIIGKDFKFFFDVKPASLLLSPQVFYKRPGVSTQTASITASGLGYSLYKATCAISRAFVLGGDFSYEIKVEDSAGRIISSGEKFVEVRRSTVVVWQEGLITLSDGNQAEGDLSLNIPPVEGDSPAYLWIRQVYSTSTLFSPLGSADERVDISVNSARPAISYQFLPLDSSYYPMSVKFTRPASLVLPYISSGTSVHLEDGTDLAVSEARLRAYFLDERNLVWRYVGGDLNTGLNTLSFAFPHFSAFAVFVTQSGGIRPVQRFLSARTVGGIDFDSAVKVVIYDPRGREVVTLTTADPAGSPIVWYGADRATSAAVPASQMVESGAYIYESLSSGGAKATGVIIVVK